MVVGKKDQKFPGKYHLKSVPVSGVPLHKELTRFIFFVLEIKVNGVKMDLHTPQGSQVNHQATGALVQGPPSGKQRRGPYDMGR